MSTILHVTYGVRFSGGRPAETALPKPLGHDLPWQLVTDNVTPLTERARRFWR